MRKVKIQKSKVNMNNKKPIIIAGGGVVTNVHGDLLMIFRRGKWDLPKGKLEKGETIEACALREVTEETGVRNLTLGKLVVVTQHAYFDVYQNQEVIKESHWYRMTVSGVPALVPQTEEDITAIEWTKVSDIPSRLRESYETIKTVLDNSVLVY
jgi:ADP-ribose pyrophosphatase YjhB (NUDIX family)